MRFISDEAHEPDQRGAGRLVRQKRITETLACGGEVVFRTASHCAASGRTNTRQSFAEAAQEAITASLEAKARRGLTGITTGLIDLDRTTGGLQRRDLILIGARPSMGKTTLGTSIARYAALSGVGVGVFSLEMDNAKLAARMVSDIAHEQRQRVPYQDLIAGRLTDTQEEAAAAALEAYASLPVLIDVASSITMADIRAKAETNTRNAEPGQTMQAICLDHAQRLADRIETELTRVENAGSPQRISP